MLTSACAESRTIAFDRREAESSAAARSTKFPASSHDFFARLNARAPSSLVAFANDATVFPVSLDADARARAICGRETIETSLVGTPRATTRATHPFVRLADDALERARGGARGDLDVVDVVRGARLGAFAHFEALESAVSFERKNSHAHETNRRDTDAT